MWMDVLEKVPPVALVSPAALCLRQIVARAVRCLRVGNGGSALSGGSRQLAVAALGSALQLLQEAVADMMTGGTLSAGWQNLR